jgi:Mor family transcriptional regulator
MSKTEEKLWSRKGSKPKRNRKIAKQVLRWREKNPIKDLAKKYGISKIRIYQIVSRYKESNEN